MIVAPINPNSIYVPLVRTGCCKSEFDSIHPVHLNGIIRQDEFQESINNINQSMSSKKSTIILSVIFAIFIAGGFTLCIAGGITAVNSRTRRFPLLAGMGCGLFFLGILIPSIGSCVLQSRRTTQLYEAVANESRKYSARTPTPCSWRLDVSRIWGGGYGRRHTQLCYQLIIDIGNSPTPVGGYMPYQYYQGPSASVYSQQTNTPPVGFCFRCGTPRPNQTAKVCLLCGQPFNI